jgi:hypothetical protein
VSGWNPQVSGTEYSGQGFSGRMPARYTSEYPVFLKPNKHYPYRRLNDSHVETVMQSALERFEKELVSIEKERNTDAEKFKVSLEENGQYL